MYPAVRSVASDEKLPDAVDVVIIGGGIVGTASAYYLAKRGLSVALLEKRPYRLRTIQPHLGLVPPAKSRPTRDATVASLHVAVGQSGQ